MISPVFLFLLPTPRDMAHLVTISPKEVPGPDVLVGIFDSLFQRRHVAPVLPMLVPQILRIDRAQDQTRYHNASVFGGHWSVCGTELQRQKTNEQREGRKGREAALEGRPY